MAGLDWTQYLGPHRDGSIAAPKQFGEQVTLERIWVKPLGSGFSGIVVGKGRLFTMHTAGEMDALSCFEAETGKLHWSYKYGSTFPKVGNSEPGPLSTPVLDGTWIYGLGAQGELFCLEASSGKLVWARNLVKELAAVPRIEGIASSPLISGDLLILNLGDQKDKGTAAFNKKTGALVWHQGEEQISFQSPSLLNLMGRQQVMALSAKNMRGLEPATGQVIWTHDSKEWIQAYAIGHGLVLAGSFHGLAVYLIDNSYGFVKISELWNNSNITVEYNMPVHHNGYLYGFKAGFVVCLNAETGKKVWQSPEGDGMAILVDGHLAIIGQDGTFRIAKVSEKGYKEQASIKIFEDSGLTAPSFADGAFYVRNYSHLAAVRAK